jgi:hypothetical protein
VDLKRSEVVSGRASGDEPPRAERFAPAGTWNRERVLAALRAWAAETGRAPYAYEWSPAKGRAAGLLPDGEVRWEREHPRWPGADTVHRYAGSWAQALVEAGLAAPPRPRAPLFERVARARALRAENCAVWLIAELLGVHSSTVSCYLHADACPRCGQPKLRRSSRTCLRCRAPNRSWPAFSDKQLLGALRAWTTEHGRPPRAADWQRRPRPGSVRWQDEFPRWPPASAVIARYGSWNAALRAAGLTPPRRARSPPETLEALRVWARKHARIPRAADWARADPDAHPSNAVAVAHFGSWSRALSAAGLTPPRRTWTPIEMLVALRDLRQQLGRPPKARDLRPPWPSAPTVYRAFGNLECAIRNVEQANSS